MESMSAEPRQQGRRFESILFDRPDHDSNGVREEPDYFVDLNLDQVLRSMTAGREEYDLSPFFYAPLRDVGGIRYRQEVLRDLEQPAVFGALAKFADGMRRMRAHLDQVEKLRNAFQRHSWFVDAVEIYCAAVRSFAEELGELTAAPVAYRPCASTWPGTSPPAALPRSPTRQRRSSKPSETSVTG